MMGAAARVDLKHFRLYTKDPSPGSSPGKAALKPNSDVWVFAAKRTATVLYQGALTEKFDPERTSARFKPALPIARCIA